MWYLCNHYSIIGRLHRSSIEFVFRCILKLSQCKHGAPKRESDEQIAAHDNRRNQALSDRDLTFTLAKFDAREGALRHHGELPVGSCGLQHSAVIKVGRILTEFKCATLLALALFCERRVNFLHMCLREAVVVAVRRIVVEGVLEQVGCALHVGAICDLTG